MDGTVIAPLVSIVIPVFNKWELTLDCLTSLAATESPDIPYEVIVVDNASSDRTRELLECLDGDVTVVRNEENLGFGRACNQGAALARAPYVLFLNNDTVLRTGWLPPLVAALDEDDRLAAVQPQLLYPDGRLNDAGGLVFANGDAWIYGKGHADPGAPQFACRRAPDYASAACLLVRRRAFDEVGGFDDRYAPAYYEDTDLSFALRAAGWKVLYEPRSTVVHVEGGTAGTDTSSGLKQYQVRNKERFAEKWADELATRPPMDAAIVERWAHRAQGGFGPGEDPVATWDEARGRAGAAASVLVVDPLVIDPRRSSGHVRLHEMIAALRCDGAHVTFFANNARGRHEGVRALSDLGVACRGVDPALVETGPGAPPWASVAAAEIRRLFQERPYDVVVIEFHYMGWLIPLIRKLSPGTRIVVDSVDVHFVRERREAELSGDAEGLARAEQTRRDELAVYRAADCVIAVTEDDAGVLRQELRGTPIVVVPNAHPVLPPGPGFDDREGILFVGNFQHPPNEDALRWWRDEVGPELRRQLPGVKLTVVGNDPQGRGAALAGEGIDVVGWVPDTLPFLHAARVSVAPLRYGAGMKGKVGEALAAGLPVVATPIAAEGMGLVDGEHALVRQDAAAFAEGVADLYHDAARWASLRAGGRRFVQRTFGQAAMADAMRQIAELASGEMRPAVGRRERQPAARGPLVSAKRS